LFVKSDSHQWETIADHIESALAANLERLKQGEFGEFKTEAIAEIENQIDYLPKMQQQETRNPKRSSFTQKLAALRKGKAAKARGCQVTRATNITNDSGAVFGPPREVGVSKLKLASSTRLLRKFF
jgi:hypothetical protein